MNEKATRDGYGEGLVEIGKDKRVVVLDADLSESTRSVLFKEKYPERFFDIGISEADMIGTAAGLATCGKISFASTFAVFATGRAYDQVRVSVAYNKLNVRVVGSHAGLLTGEDGASHQALEDIALMRALPNMTVIQPADYVEAVKAVHALLEYRGPAYLRLTRGKVPIIFDDKYKFKIGKGVVLRQGKDAAVFATGVMVHKALEAAEILDKKRIRIAVVNIHTIKPIDKELIIRLAKETKAVVTAEDHNIIGGLGSAVAEVLAENKLTNLERLGVKDKFGESGNPEDLFKKYGLTAADIEKAVIKVTRRKEK